MRARSIVLALVLAPLALGQDPKKPSFVGKGLLRQASSVTCVAASANLLAAGLDDGSVVFFSPVSHEPIHAHTGPRTAGPVLAVSIDLDEKLMLVASAERLDVYDAKTFECVATTKPPSPLAAAVLAPEGDAVYALGLDGTLAKRRSGDLVVVASTATVGTGTAVAVSRDGTHVAASHADGTIDLLTGNLEKRRSWTAAEKGQGISGLAFDIPGEKLASGATDGTVRVWVNGEKRAEGKVHEQPVAGLAFLLDGRLVTGGLEGRTTFWKAGTFEVEASFTRYRGQIRCLVASPDGQTVLRGGGILEILPVAQPSLPDVLGSYGGSITALALAGNKIATASLDRTVTVWDAQLGARGTTFTFDDWATALASGADGKLLAVGLESGWIAILTINAPSRGLFPAHGSEVTGLAFAGEVLVSGGIDGKIAFWSPPTHPADKSEAALGEPIEAGAPVTCLAADPDGKLVAAGTTGGEVLVIDVATRKTRSTVRVRPCSVRSVAFSPKGDALAVGAHDGSLLVIDPATGKTLKAWPGYGQELRSVAWAPSGSRLAIAFADGTFALFDAEKLAYVAGAGVRSELEAIAFLDEKTLAVAGAEQVVFVFEWKP